MICTKCGRDLPESEFYTVEADSEEEAVNEAIERFYCEGDFGDLRDIEAEIDCIYQGEI